MKISFLSLKIAKIIAYVTGSILFTTNLTKIAQLITGKDLEHIANRTISNPDIKSNRQYLDEFKYKKFLKQLQEFLDFNISAFALPFVAGATIFLAIPLFILDGLLFNFYPLYLLDNILLFNKELFNRVDNQENSYAMILVEQYSLLASGVAGLGYGIYSGREYSSLQPEVNLLPEIANSEIINISAQVIHVDNLTSSQKNLVTPQQIS